MPSGWQYPTRARLRLCPATRNLRGEPRTGASPGGAPLPRQLWKCGDGTLPGQIPAPRRACTDLAWGWCPAVLLAPKHWSALIGHYCPQTSPRQTLPGAPTLGSDASLGRKTFLRGGMAGIRTLGHRAGPLPQRSRGDGLGTKSFLKIVGAAVGVAEPWGVPLKRKRALGLRVCGDPLPGTCAPCTILEHALPSRHTPL